VADGAESEASERGAKVGLVLMLVATLCFVAMTVFVKLLREDGLSTNEVMFWRVAPGLPWVWMELRLRKQTIWPNAPGPTVARSLYGLGAMACYFYALRALSVIEYTVLTLLQPVLVAMLAPALLDERLSRNAVFALGVALAGALVVLRPDRVGPIQLEWLAIAVGIVATVFSALAHISVRKATAYDSPERVVFWFTLVVSVLAAIMGLANGDFVGGLPAGLEPGPAVLKIAGAAGFGLAGQLLMTRAYGRAAAPIVAMMSYASIPASIVVDLVVWGLHPDVAQITGSILMIGAGVLLMRGRP
jgi:drug/metabolite transporter (DMT)-like permease